MSQQCVIDGRGTTAYHYDLLDRLTRIDQPDGVNWVGYSYDQNGNRTSITAPGGVTGYSYDPAGRLETVTAPDGGITRYAYDAASRPESVTAPNQMRTFFDYDARDRLLETRQVHLPSAQMINRITTHYDLTGQRTTAQEFLGGRLEHLTWNYDPAGRLTVEARTDHASGSIYETRFTYDATGNRLTQTTNGLQTRYAYDALDRLLTAQNSAGMTAYQYDARGNMTSATVALTGAAGDPATTSYTWDAQNRLVGVTTPTGAHTTHSYDADGRRVTAVTGVSVRHFVWDERSRYGDVVAELDASGGLVTAYVLANGAVISQTHGGAGSHFFADSLSSTRALTDASGAVTDTYSYTAYGELHSQTGSTSNAYLYAGQQYDSASGLYTMRARWYAPSVGRFISRDTFPLNMHNPVEWNRYGYAAGDPVNGRDPSGYSALTEYALKVGRSTAAGASSGAYNGGVSGYVMGAVSYIIGASGVCGNVMQQGVFNTDPNDYIVKSTMLGIVEGAAMGAMIGTFGGALGPAGAAGAAMGVTVYSVSDAYSEFVRAPTVCTFLLFMIEVADAVGSLPNVDMAVYRMASDARYRNATPEQVEMALRQEVGDDVYNEWRLRESETSRIRRGCVNSFSAETPIATPNGDVPIAELEIGDEVYAYNEETGEVGEYPITATISHYDPVIYYVIIAGELIETTAEHPFYTDDEKWVQAAHLDIGEQVRDIDGDYGTVEHVEAVDSPQPMYNLTVDEAHTFFVGDGQWLVHNVRCVPNGVKFNAGFGRGTELEEFALMLDDTYFWKEWPDALIERTPGQGDLANIANPIVMRNFLPTIFRRIREGKLHGGEIRFNLQNLLPYPPSDYTTMLELHSIVNDPILYGMTAFYNGASNRLTADEAKARLSELGIVID